MSNELKACMSQLSELLEKKNALEDSMSEINELIDNKKKEIKQIQYMSFDFQVDELILSYGKVKGQLSLL